MGIVAILTTSCGSYQNSSYYDNDGVYGSERPVNQTENKYTEQNIEKSNKSLAVLEKELKAAVKMENFEKAVTLKKEIDFLKSNQ